MTFFFPADATPIDDISGLKPDWVQTQADLNRVEAENIAQAVGKFLENTLSHPLEWFNVPILRSIHREMFGEVWRWAGKYRRTQTRPGIAPHRIPLALGELCRDVLSWSEGSPAFTVLERAVRIHHRLTWIHPFPNGNGRFSRLISDRYLKAYGCQHPRWPSDLATPGPCRKQYIDALKAADTGDYDPLIAFEMKHGATEHSSVLS